ncbi:hypothetical protein PV08_04384 [Exophiala spinifera]|uniref:GED domain-containing protein n=1 Tax=Exophiala spinifera TaxID=91928 RepID=A0A0D2BE00_9EURO|nr:uncharacterized protein PV08_04384 [Exophiala spinifera]KIW17193.1 hypothetical protein PV08_04384 [Exophiala spinifera]
MGIDITKSSIHVFQSQERLELLNDIDKFRRHGLANLPQIVVCGDTSSGKSSVLGALSGIAFPVSSTICTRFATEFALRYTSEDAVTGHATISAASGSSDAHQSRVKSFHRTITSLDNVPEIMEEAKQIMDLANDASISRDVLHLEIHGRDLPNLTLVDLPGLIHSANDQKDVDKVIALIDYYFTQTESIILIVVSAENIIYNQGILAKARSFDPIGERSIGVITKADQLMRADKRGMLPTIVTLAKNEHPTFRFKRPWHIVRCLNDDERRKGADREALERDLFRQDPWDTFGYAQLGIHSLTSALSTYLEEHITRLLPDLIVSLEKKIERVSRDLNTLGPARTTHRELEQYLVNMSSQYTRLVENALAGNYSDPFFQDDKETTRLRAATMAVVDAFESSMRSQGHTFEITKSSSTHSIRHQNTTPASTALIWPEHHPDRIDLREALTIVETLLKNQRGPELSFLFNPGLIGELFKVQSRKWSTIASECSGEMCRVVRAFLRKVVQYICPQTGQMAERVLRHVFDDALENIQETLGAKNSELLAPFKGSFFYSTKVKLQASLKEIERQDAIDDDLEEKARSGTKTKETPGIFVDSRDVGATAGADEPTRRKMLQYSRAYYNVALENFIDNIVILGFEACLLSKLSDIFSPQTASRMDDEMLQLLAGESPRQMRQREDLQRELQTLKNSLKTCKRHDSRAFRSNNTSRADAQAPPSTPEVKTQLGADSPQASATKPHKPESVSNTTHPISSVSKSASVLPENTPSVPPSVLPASSSGARDKSPSPQNIVGQMLPKISSTPPTSSSSKGFSSGSSGSNGPENGTTNSNPGKSQSELGTGPTSNSNSGSLFGSYTGPKSDSTSGFAAGTFGALPKPPTSIGPKSDSPSGFVLGTGSMSNFNSGSLFGSYTGPKSDSPSGFGSAIFGTSTGLKSDSTSGFGSGTGFTSNSNSKPSLFGSGTGAVNIDKIEPRSLKQSSDDAKVGTPAAAAKPTGGLFGRPTTSTSSPGTSTDTASTSKPSGDSSKAVVKGGTSAGSQTPLPTLTFSLGKK